MIYQKWVKNFGVIYKKLHRSQNNGSEQITLKISLFFHDCLSSIVNDNVEFLVLAWN